MDSKNISFNDMSQIMAVMYDKLNELGDKVDRLMPTEKSEEPQWMNVAALIEYLPNHPAEQTVYGWTSDWSSDVCSSDLVRASCSTKPRLTNG